VADRLLETAPDRVRQRLAGDDGEPAPGVPPAAGIVTLEPTDHRHSHDDPDPVRQRRADGLDARHGDAGGMGLAIAQIDALLEPVNRLKPARLRR